MSSLFAYIFPTNNEHTKSIDENKQAETTPAPEKNETIASEDGNELTDKSPLSASVRDEQALDEKCTPSLGTTDVNGVETPGDSLGSLQIDEKQDAICKRSVPLDYSHGNDLKKTKYENPDGSISDAPKGIASEDLAITADVARNAESQTLDLAISTDLAKRADSSAPDVSIATDLAKPADNSALDLAVTAIAKPSDSPAPDVAITADLASRVDSATPDVAKRADGASPDVTITADLAKPADGAAPDVAFAADLAKPADGSIPDVAITADLVIPAESPTLDLAITTNLSNRANSPAPIAASAIGITLFNDFDVLSGRGGGTNVHPGNRNFRELINLHRKAYLKARKNDKPAISRAIVRSVREHNGRFLRKDELTGLWLEIGDEAAREKTSQALRQRAPEMRKLLFDTEREEGHVASEEQVRQHQMILNSGGPILNPPNALAQSVFPQGVLTQGVLTQGALPQQLGAMPMYPAVQPIFFHTPLLYQAFTQVNQNGIPAGNAPNMSVVPYIQNPYSQMFSAALLGQGPQQVTRDSV